MELDNPKVIRAWTFYDWANSAYSLIITSAIFPMYYTALAPEKINIFGRYFERTPVASFAISLSYIIIAILSPLLSSIADYYGNKKIFMKFFCYFGAAACIGMFFFTRNEITNESNYFYGLLCSILASIGYCGSIVFYNAFLPEISAKENQDKVSAKGFAMGYVGSVLLMLVCFALIVWNEKTHVFPENIPARVSFVLVGIWWVAFAQISFRTLQEEKKHSDKISPSILLNGYSELKEVWQSLKTLPQLQRFLVSFFFYNMGVQTVMYMAVYFAKEEIKMETTQLLATILIIQVVAIGGAYLCSKLSKKVGNQKVLMALIVIWILICVLAFMVQTVKEFYVLAFAVGMVMGGIQSISRSTYSKLLPQTHDTASYFSFFDVCDKMGIVIGTLSFGVVADQFGNRNSILAIALFFVGGIILLTRLSNSNFKKA
jgi:MFS transporter, UMF1 family